MKDGMCGEGIIKCFNGCKNAGNTVPVPVYV